VERQNKAEVDERSKKKGVDKGIRGPPQGPIPVKTKKKMGKRSPQGFKSQAKGRRGWRKTEVGKGGVT